MLQNRPWSCRHFCFQKMFLIIHIHIFIIQCSKNIRCNFKQSDSTLPWTIIPSLVFFGCKTCLEVIYTQNAICICPYLCVVQELEVAGPVGSLIHSLGKLYRATSALRPVVTGHSVRCSTLFCKLTHKVNLCLGVRPDGSPRETFLAVLGCHDDNISI